MRTNTAPWLCEQERRLLAPSNPDLFCAEMLLTIALSLAVVFAAFLVLAWARSELGSSRRFGIRIAAHLGISYSLLHALLDRGSRESPILLLSMLERSGLDLQEASVRLAPFLAKGLEELENRFGRQEMITRAGPVVAELVRQWERSRTDPAR